MTKYLNRNYYNMSIYVHLSNFRGETMRKMTALIFVLCFFSSVLSIEASGGQISSSKITYCSGVSFESHGPDEHWHKAQKKGDRWYPEGPDLGYTHPCPSTPVANNSKPASNNSTISKPVTNQPSQADIEKKLK